MALFKISKGLKEHLPAEKTAGFCWYTINDSLFYIDYEDENGVVQRQALNAKDAETLTGASLSTILNASDIEIPTSAAVLNAIAGTLPLKVTLTADGEDFTADKSFIEITTAYNNGRTVFLTYKNGVYPLTLVRTTRVTFELNEETGRKQIQCRHSNDADTWEYTETPQTQADWSETYEDSASYIRNKPFGDFYAIRRTGDETTTVTGKYTTFTLVSTEVLEYEELSGVALYAGSGGSFPSLTRFSDNAYGNYNGILVITQDGTTCSQVSNNPFPKAGIYLGAETEYAVLQYKKIPEKYIPSKFETTDSVQAKIDEATADLASKEYVDSSMTVTTIDTQLTAAEIMALPDGMYYFTDNAYFLIYLYDSWAEDESAYVTDVAIRGLCKFTEYEIFSYDTGTYFYKDDPKVYDGAERVCCAVESATPMHTSYAGMYQLTTRPIINVYLRQYKDGTIEYENNNNYIEYLRTFGWGISSVLTQCTIHTNNTSQDLELYEVEKLVGDDDYLYGIKYVGYKDNYRYDVVCELNGITVNKTEIVTKDYVDSKTSGGWEVLMDVTVTEECVEVIGETLTTEQKEKIANGDFVCYAECPPPTTTTSTGWICGGLWANNMYYFILSGFGQPSGIVPASTDTHTSKIYSNLKNASGDMRIRDMLYTTSGTPHQLVDFMDASEYMTHYQTQPLTVRFKTNGKFAVGTRLVCKVR